MSAEDRPTVAEIAALVRKLRELTELGPDADPDAREAFLTEKRELIARIEELGQ